MKTFCISVPYTCIQHGINSYIIEAEDGEKALQEFLDAEDLDVRYMDITRYGPDDERWEEAVIVEVKA